MYMRGCSIGDVSICEMICWMIACSFIKLGWKFLDVNSTSTGNLCLEFEAF